VAAEITFDACRVLLVQGDITGEKVQAIVNAANSGLMGGGGVDGAIHRAGGVKIKEECREIVKRIGRLPAGRAVITSGGNLPAKYVIHTVGPVWQGGRGGEAETLASCYRESLKLAVSGMIKSIAFPAISTGVYGYPVEQAARVAVDTVIGFLSSAASPIELVEFVLFDGYSYSIYESELDLKKADKG
jgi:O-acetyl-ADP-ribose deacetylase